MNTPPTRSSRADQTPPADQPVRTELSLNPRLRLQALAQRFRQVPLGVWLSMLVIGWLLIAALTPGLLTSRDPLAIHPSEGFTPPNLTHLLGTDESGRDIYTRIVHGARASLLIGLSATAIGMGLGLVMGLVAGLGPRVVDAALTWVMNVLFALPTLIMALVFVAIRGPGLGSAVIAIGLATAPGYGRMVRAQVLTLRQAEYLRISVTLGETPWQRMRRHVLPGVLAPMISMLTLGIAQSIVWVCALSFLGLGALPPAPEWGAMLNGGRLYLSTGWWMMVMPGLVITLAALAFTTIGRYWARINDRTSRAGTTRGSGVPKLGMHRSGGGVRDEGDRHSGNEPLSASVQHSEVKS